MVKMFSVEMAAELLNVSPWTIRAWIKQGKLGSAKLGSRRLVPQSDIEDFVNKSLEPALTGGRREPAAEAA